MADKKTAVFGIYSSRESAERAADAIVKAGFSPADISVLLPENLGNRSIGTEKATKAPEGAAAGGGTGAVLGGTLGLLAGIGALAIPGVGPLIAAGPIMATLAGLGVALGADARTGGWFCAATVMDTVADALDDAPSLTLYAKLSAPVYPAGSK